MTLVEESMEEGEEGEGQEEREPPSLTILVSACLIHMYNVASWVILRDTIFMLFCGLALVCKFSHPPPKITPLATYT